MNNGLIIDEIDNLCNVEYGTRVIKKKHGGTIYSVYGGGGATFFMDDYNRENRLIIARFAMSQKCTRFVRKKFFLNDSGLTLSPKNTIQLDQDFLDYQCLAMNDVFYSLAKGSAQKNLDVPAFRKIKLKIPKDIEVQKKIVVKLNTIFAEIDKATAAAEANINNAKALFRSFLHKVFLKIDNYNKPIKLRKIIKLEYGKGLKESERDLNGIYGAYGANGIKSKTNRYLYDKPSIIIGRKGSAGELTIVTEKFWALDVTYYVTHDDSKTDLYFLYYALKILNIPSLSKGIKPGINRNDVYDLSITIPKINDQKLIVKNIFAFSNSLNLVIDLLKKKKIELYSLKQSILKQAFNGELVKAA